MKRTLKLLDLERGKLKEKRELNLISKSEYLSKLKAIRAKYLEIAHKEEVVPVTKTSTKQENLGLFPTLFRN